jgi:hypothetical protein
MNFSITNQQLIWFSRILRWTVGSFFTTAGIMYSKQGVWPAIVFGLVIFLTGFLKPKRCIDGECNI